MDDSGFWSALDQLISRSPLVIDRPGGSSHPRYPSIVYPLDYGYLAGTSSMDGAGIDVWLGSDPARRLGGVICTVDLIKGDSEIKLLLGCTGAETQAVLSFHNSSQFMKGLLIPRPDMTSYTNI